MQCVGLLVIVILLFHYELIRSAPTDTAAPGEHESSKSQLIDTGMTHGSSIVHHHKEKKSIDYYEYRHVVADGVQKALDECREKFKWDRWNCPKKAFLSILDREEFSAGTHPLPSNKELGLTRALIASGIVLSMIKSCSIGTNSMCSCTNPTIMPASRADIFNPERHHKNPIISSASDSHSHISQQDQLSNQQESSILNQPIAVDEPNLKETESELMVQDQPMSTDLGIETQPAVYEAPKNSKFSWAGCDEIVKFGFKVAKIYLDSQDNLQGDASRLINAHNYEAGRQAVRKTMRRKCKCHGTSGTCQVNTCWTVVPDMSEVGDHLKRQYRVAAKVGAISAKETDAASLTKELSAISPDKLVFADASPDYCYENKQLGINGTLGRYCSRTKHRSDGSEVSRSERDSCDRLCTKCGYKIKRERINVERQCDCRFVYCCTVECQRCPHVEETYKCVRHS